MSDPRTGVTEANPDDPTGHEVISRLHNDRVGWLTTVASDGTTADLPDLVPLERGFNTDLQQGILPDT